MPTTFVSPQVFEDMADKIREFTGLFDPISIDITKLAKRLGFFVYETAMPDDISGMIKFENGYFSIYVNSLESEQRQRFTIAHEIGHALLHEADLKKSGEMVDYRRSIDYYSGSQLRKEVQANMLAAALLMPKKSFVNEWVRTNDIDNIAEIFNVSKKAATVRLESLDLLL